MNILLTGQPGIGKTTAIRRIVSKIGPDKTGGFWSEEIREGRHRVGFKIRTIEGEEGILAHVQLAAGPRVSKYTVNVTAVREIAVPAMRRAREDGCIVVVDEIAKMELFSPEFRKEVLNCLDAGRTVGTIQNRSTDFLEEVRSRDDITLMEITHGDRDEIPDRVVALLKDAI
ncbi:NTPase [Candidatus Thorarchaeota archaeon]|nr:MAG: NTPase [Candidatus Thorarchaeota archaeon]